MAAAEAERAKTESEAWSLPGVFPEWADIARSPTPHPSRLLGQFLFVPGFQHFKPIFRLSDKLPQAGFNAGVLGEAPNRAQTNEPAPQPSFFVFPIHRRPIGTAVPTIGPPSHGTISAGQPYWSASASLSPARQTRSDRGANCGAFRLQEPQRPRNVEWVTPRLVYPARGQPVRSPLSG
jgi:hypothetical protein